MTTLQFRNATREDSELILTFIKKLAVYEKMIDDVQTSREDIEHWVFDKHSAEVIFACIDGVEIGFALYFYNFSTFVGKAGLYLEDIFIDESYRGHGYGKEIFNELIRIAVANSCGRMEWVCLDWNTPSIAFYKSLGAYPLEDWTIYRLDYNTLQNLHKNMDK